MWIIVLIYLIFCLISFIIPIMIMVEIILWFVFQFSKYYFFVYLYSAVQCMYVILFL